MDGDKLALMVLQDGGIEVDFESGQIYSRRIRGKEGQRILLKGTNIRGYITHKICYKEIRKPVRAHRIIWIAAHGLIPDGLMIDHINRIKDDNRLVNLRLVDAKENAANRSSCEGEHNPAAKLTQEQVQEIREMRAEGMYIRDIAKVFNISKSQVHNIVSNLSWKERMDAFSAEIDMDWLDRYQWPAGPGQPQYDYEPSRIITEKQQNRVARLKALGNAIVVPCVEYIGRCLVAREMDGVA